MYYRIARMNDDGMDTVYWEGTKWVEHNDGNAIYNDWDYVVTTLATIIGKQGEEETNKYWYTIELGKTTKQVFWPTDDEYNKIID